jgi:hemerythrin superfamily protein
MSDQGMTGAKADAVELLTSHHRAFEQLWKRLQDAHAAGDHVQSTLSRELITLLSQHDAIETQFLYPELRKLDGQGEQLAEHSLEEHQQIRELLKEVDGADPADPQVIGTFDRCMRIVFGHAEEEEGEAFPLLRTLGEERVRDLGERMSGAMAMAPTHPHPTTPNSKVGATVAGAAMGVVDRARDAMNRDEGS